MIFSYSISLLIACPNVSKIDLVRNCATIAVDFDV
jgi:hypothetical protein